MRPVHGESRMLYRAAASLPSEDQEQASAELHRQLRVIAGAVGVTPDWTTFRIDGPTHVPGRGGQSRFEWSATVSAEDPDQDVDPDALVDDAEPISVASGETQPFAAPGPGPADSSRTLQHPHPPPPPCGES